MDACAICGRESRYIFAFPSGANVSAGVVYDGAPVCSPTCALALRKRHEEEHKRHEEERKRRKEEHQEKREGEAHKDE